MTNFKANSYMVPASLAHGQMSLPDAITLRGADGKVGIRLRSGEESEQVFFDLAQAENVVKYLQRAIEDATPSTPALIAKKITSLTEQIFQGQYPTNRAKLLDEIVDLCQELEELDVSPAQSSDDERVEAYKAIVRLLSNAPRNLNTLASVRTIVDRVGS